GATMFLPAPHQQIGERDDPAHPGGGVQYGDVLSVRHPKRRDIAGVVQADARQLSRLQLLARVRRESVQHGREVLERLAPAVLPPSPVPDEPITEGWLAAFRLQPVPDLARRKDISRQSIWSVALPSASRGIPRRVPYRKAAVH